MGTIEVKMEELSVTIPMNEFLRLKELETRIKIANEAFERDGYLCGSDIVDILNFKKGTRASNEDKEDKR